MTVAHAVAGVWLDQTQAWLYNQVRFLPGRVRSHILCESTRNLDQFALTHIHALYGGGGLSARVDRLVRRIGLRRHPVGLEAALRHGRVDVLHSHFGWVGWENCRAARRLGIPHVVTFYGLDVNYLPKHGWSRRYVELFELVDRVLCEGPHMAACIERLGCPRQKLRVQHLGADVRSIEFRPRFWTPTEPLRVLIAASFREKKGIPYAIEALARLSSEVPVAVTIIGDAGDAPAAQAEKRRILAAVERFGLTNHVRLLGFQPYRVLFEEAYRHHVFMAPSVTASNGDTEGGAPVTLIEMAATGMPIISTRHCDIPEIIEHGVTGLLAGERDVSGLVEQLRRLVSLPSQWRTMSERGRRRIEDSFDAPTLGETLAQVYDTVSLHPVSASKALRSGNKALP